GGYSDAITAQHVLAAMDIEILPLPEHDADDYTAGKARFAERYIDYCEYMQLTETFRIRESKLRQFGGGDWRYSWWGPQGGEQSVHRRVMQDPPVKLAPDSYTCADCGMSGPTDALNPAAPACPDCGSQQIATTEAPPVTLPQVVGYQTIPVGAGRTEAVP